MEFGGGVRVNISNGSESKKNWLVQVAKERINIAPYWTKFPD